MDELTISVFLAFLLLAVGSYTDLRTREVPDWISHGFIYLGFGLNLILSIIYLDFYLLLYSIIGFVVCFLIGLAMYKLGQWGGGDTKVIMGIGAVVGFNPGSLLLLTFLINTVLVGAVYGIIWSLIVAFQNWKTFKKSYLETTRTKKIVRIRILLYFVVVVAVIFAFFISPGFKLELFLLATILFFLTHLWIMIRVVEKSCMIKDVSPAKLTEGDWIAEDVVVKGRTITGPKDLGIEKKQIALLLKLGIKKVKVKYGIPFVPSFLIAFILAVMLGAWYLGIFSYVVV